MNNNAAAASVVMCISLVLVSASAIYTRVFQAKHEESNNQRSDEGETPQGERPHKYEMELASHEPATDDNDEHNDNTSDHTHTASGTRTGKGRTNNRVEGDGSFCASPLARIGPGGASMSLQEQGRGPVPGQVIDASAGGCCDFGAEEPEQGQRDTPQQYLHVRQPTFQFADSEKPYS